MFKQMLLFTSAQPVSKRRSFIYNDSLKSRGKKRSSSLDRLNNAECSVLESEKNRCKSAKTFREIKRLEPVPMLDLKEVKESKGMPSELNEDEKRKNQIIPELSLSVEHQDVQQNVQQDVQLDPNEEEDLNHLRIRRSLSSNPNIGRTLRALSSRFRARTAEVKRKLEKQLSSEDEGGDTLSDEEQIPDYSESWFEEDFGDKRGWSLNDLVHRLKNLSMFIYDYDLNLHTYELYSVSYISWLTILTGVYLYNCWFIIIRAFFPIQTSENLYKFILFDLVCDSVYLLDIFWFRSRLRYFENGLLIKEAHLTRKRYFQKPDFLVDCLSLLPLELLYPLVGVKPLLRLPRFLKWSCFEELFHCLDSIANNPYIFRIIRTLVYMMFLVHLNATAYYYMSYLTDFDPNNQWVYNNEGNAYLRCFYFAIRTATSISGRMPKPNNSYERAFMTVSWLMGVFVFAFLIGQIRDIVANATQNETHYRMIMDQTTSYMNNLHLPKITQQRVKDWLNFTWRQQNTFDELAILSTLPNKSCTDISLNLHLEMLKQVELFHCVERPVICELVNFLRPILFLPGDFIFRKDDVGNSMYIVNKGLVEVYADREGTKLLVTLGKGSVFGEISVLDLPGSSKRRTASIRSVGYSTLFILQKTDLLDILSNYPEAHANLKRKANQMIRQRNKQAKAAAQQEDKDEFESIRAESVIKNPIAKGKNSLANTVIQLIERRRTLSV